MQATREGVGDDSSVSTAAAADDEKRRAAAVCEHCGSVHVVHVFPDATVHVIGTAGSCGCGGEDFRILGEHEGPEATTEETSAGETTGV